MPASNVSMTFTNPNGTPVSNGYVIASLSGDASTNDGQQIVAGLKVRGQLNNSGTTVGFSLWPNDQLSPSDLFYNLEVFDFNGVFVWSGTTMSRTSAITYIIDGGGSVPATGAKGQISVPMACTITGWVITADQSGSAVVDVLRSTYAGFPSTSSIAGTSKPTLSSAQKNEDLVLTNWGSTSIVGGDEIQFNLNSVTTCTRLNITLNITVP
jgi:hypothetical protein